RGGRAVEAGGLQLVEVVEQREAAHGGGQPVPDAVDLRGLDERRELLVERGVVEVLLGQRDHVAGALPGGEPAVEELHDVGTLAGGQRGRDLLRVAVVRERLVPDDDVGVLRLEPLDQPVHGVDASGELALPVGDRPTGARRPGEQQRDDRDERPLHPLTCSFLVSRNRALAAASASLRSRRARRSPSRRSPARTSLSLIAAGAGMPSPARRATNAAGSTACLRASASSRGPPAATRSSGVAAVSGLPSAASRLTSAATTRCAAGKPRPASRASTSASSVAVVSVTAAA